MHPSIVEPVPSSQALDDGIEDTTPRSQPLPLTPAMFTPGDIYISSDPPKSFMQYLHMAAGGEPLRGMLPFTMQLTSTLVGISVFGCGMYFITILPEIFVAIQAALRGGAFFVSDAIALAMIALAFISGVYASLWLGFHAQRSMHQITLQIEAYVTLAIARL